jgi:myo-inositol-1(or 4)-monophosphatase
MSLEEELLIAADAARCAGRGLLRSFRGSTGDVRFKQGDAREPVSAADIEADGAIQAALTAAFPDDGILSEETPTLAGSSGRSWLIDPLDGTANFLSGIPFWGVSIALKQDDDTVLATVYDPVRDELFQSARGVAATANTSLISPSQTEVLEHGVVSIVLWPADAAHEEVVAIARRLRGVRQMGATALELAWVACGRLDGCLFRRNDSPWDWSAGARLVLDSGGIVRPARLPIPAITIAAGTALASAF